MKTVKFLPAALSIALLAAGCSIFNFGGGGGGTVFGAMKSVDSGETWDLKSKADNNGNIAGVSSAHIRLNPTNRKQLFIASPTSGVYISDDQAELWRRILSGPVIYDIQVNPKDGNEMFAGGANNGVAKVFKTADGGTTWTEVYSEAKGGSFVSAISYHLTDAKALYIGLSTGEVLQSTNSGSSWTLLSKLDDRILSILMPKDNVSTLYAYNINSGLHRSTDNGKTWQTLTKGQNGQGGIDANKFYDMKPAPDNAAILYLATGNGMYVTRDRGATFAKLQLPLHEGSSTAVTSVTVSPKDGNQLFAVVDGTFYKSSDGGATWKTKAIGSTGSVRDLVIDPEENNVMYAALGQGLQ